ncbi:MAG: hypothetical protein R2800_08305 [Flavipsychrobacter sp.]
MMRTVCYISILLLLATYSYGQRYRLVEVKDCNCYHYGMDKDCSITKYSYKKGTQRGSSFDAEKVLFDTMRHLYFFDEKMKISAVDIYNDIGLLDTSYLYWYRDDATIPFMCYKYNAKQQLVAKEYFYKAYERLTFDDLINDTLDFNTLTSYGLQLMSVDSMFYKGEDTFLVKHYEMDIQPQISSSGEQPDYIVTPVLTNLQEHIYAGATISCQLVKPKMYGLEAKRIWYDKNKKPILITTCSMDSDGEYTEKDSTNIIYLDSNTRIEDKYLFGKVTSSTQTKFVEERDTLNRVIKKIKHWTYNFDFDDGFKTVEEYKYNNRGFLVNKSYTLYNLYNAQGNRPQETRMTVYKYATSGYLRKKVYKRTTYDYYPKKKRNSYRHITTYTYEEY